MPMKSKRMPYTAAFKLKVVDLAKTHSNRGTERHFNISEKMVRDWNKESSIKEIRKSKRANTGIKDRWISLESKLN